MRIDSMLPSKRVRGRWLCHMEDGSILRVGEGEVASFALHTGMELSTEILAALNSATVRSTLREKALALIAARPLSRKELVDKLAAKAEGEDAQQVVQETADWLEELGYLNDAAYAEAVAQHYAVKGYGERKIRDELWRRGVPREYWETAAQAAPPPDEGIDAFLRQKLRGREPDRDDLRRLSAALARRGYGWEDVKEGLRRYGAEPEE